MLTDKHTIRIEGRYKTKYEIRNKITKKLINSKYAKIVKKGKSCTNFKDVSKLSTFIMFFNIFSVAILVIEIFPKS